MAKKRIISKTESKLRNQLKYQRSKNSKEVKALSKDIQANFHRVGTKTKGEQTKKSTDYWERNKQIMQRNKDIAEIERKLQRFKYKKREPKKLEAEEGTILQDLILGSAWEVSTFHEVLKLAVKYYQGVPISKSRQKMLSDLISEVLTMDDSTDILYGVTDLYDNLLYFEIR